MKRLTQTDYYLTRIQTEQVHVAFRGDGYVPNSVLVKILFGREESDESSEPQPTRWRPPTVTADQLDQIAHLKVSLHQTHHVVISSDLASYNALKFKRWFQQHVAIQNVSGFSFADDYLVLRLSQCCIS